MGKITFLGSAKRDDPIYSSGLMVHFKPPLTPSTKDTVIVTDGALPQGPTSDLQNRKAGRLDKAVGMESQVKAKLKAPSTTAKVKAPRD